jgi:hypothetical protein
MSKTEEETLSHELAALVLAGRELEKKIQDKKAAIEELEKKKRKEEDKKKEAVLLEQLASTYQCGCMIGEDTECGKPRHSSTCFECGVRFCIATCGHKGLCCKCAGL